MSLFYFEKETGGQTLGFYALVYLANLFFERLDFCIGNLVTLSCRLLMLAWGFLPVVHEYLNCKIPSPQRAPPGGCLGTANKPT